MLNYFLILLGKAIFTFSKSLNLGAGSTWPGHIALKLNKNFISQILKNTKAKTILVAGTNGKTTTAKLIQTILEKSNKKVFRNQSGANLLNGIASTIIKEADFKGSINSDYIIFEIDENTLPLVIKQVKLDNLILLNLFRDQLDRYGEVDTIARNWKKSLNTLSKDTTLILNADDPQIALLGKETKGKVLYFGLNEKEFATYQKQHAADTTYCPNCGSKLIFDTIYFSHIGIWKCNNCKEKRPQTSINTLPYYPLSGVYNKYNTLAAVLFAQNIGIKDEDIITSLKTFNPAFGRQEILEIKNKKVQLFLSKNPTSFNESFRTIVELNAKNILFVLNDRIPDGKDVSWIWDIDLEEKIDKFSSITVSGDRTYDMGIRIKYAINDFKNENVEIIENLENAVNYALEKTKENGMLFILPTYSGMLEVRKILTGKKIL